MFINYMDTLYKWRKRRQLLNGQETRVTSYVMHQADNFHTVVLFDSERAVIGIGNAKRNPNYSADSTPVGFTIALFRALDDAVKKGRLFEDAEDVDVATDELRVRWDNVSG